MGIKNKKNEKNSDLEKNIYCSQLRVNSALEWKAEISI